MSKFDEQNFNIISNVRALLHFVGFILKIYDFWLWFDDLTFFKFNFFLWFNTLLVGTKFCRCLFLFWLFMLLYYKYKKFYFWFRYWRKLPPFNILRRNQLIPIWQLNYWVAVLPSHLLLQLNLAVVNSIRQSPWASQLLALIVKEWSTNIPAMHQHSVSCVR